LSLLEELLAEVEARAGEGFALSEPASPTTLVDLARRKLPMPLLTLYRRIGADTFGLLPDREGERAVMVAADELADPDASGWYLGTGDSGAEFHWRQGRLLRDDSAVASDLEQVYAAFLEGLRAGRYGWHPLEDRFANARAVLGMRPLEDVFASLPSPAQAAEAFARHVGSMLVDGQEVGLGGFGTFSLSVRRAFQGHHPATGEVVAVPSRRIPVFRAGPAFKAALNGDAPSYSGARVPGIELAPAELEKVLVEGFARVLGDDRTVVSRAFGVFSVSRRRPFQGTNPRDRRGDARARADHPGLPGVATPQRGAEPGVMQMTDHEREMLAIERARLRMERVSKAITLFVLLATFALIDLSGLLHSYSASVEVVSFMQPLWQPACAGADKPCPVFLDPAGRVPYAPDAELEAEVSARFSVQNTGRSRIEFSGGLWCLYERRSAQLTGTALREVPSRKDDGTCTETADWKLIDSRTVAFDDVLSTGGTSSRVVRFELEPGTVAQYNQRLYTLAFHYDRKHGWIERILRRVRQDQERLDSASSTWQVGPVPATWSLPPLPE
jgi:nucleoid DNA-binding protein